MEFKEKIKIYRSLNDLTQKQFADKIGVTTSDISRWENDKKEPETKEYIVLAKYLNVSLDYLMIDQITDERDVAFNRSLKDYVNRVTCAKEHEQTINLCKEFLDNSGIDYNKDLLPTTFGLNIAMNGCLVKDGKVYLVYDELLKYDEIELIRKYNLDQVRLNDAIRFDDPMLIENAIKNHKRDISSLPDQLNSSKRNPFGTKLTEQTKARIQFREELNKSLGLLDNKSDNYYMNIKVLIEGGASFTTINHENGEEMDDKFKTDFVYRVATDIIKLTEEKKEQ